MPVACKGSHDLNFLKWHMFESCSCEALCFLQWLSVPLNISHLVALALHALFIFHIFDRFLGVIQSLDRSCTSLKTCKLLHVNAGRRVGVISFIRQFIPLSSILTAFFFAYCEVGKGDFLLLTEWHIISWNSSLSTYLSLIIPYHCCLSFIWLQSCTLIKALYFSEKPFCEIYEPTSANICNYSMSFWLPITYHDLTNYFSSFTVHFTERMHI